MKAIIFVVFALCLLMIPVLFSNALSDGDMVVKGSQLLSPDRSSHCC